jgi:hypothetical protein
MAADKLDFLAFTIAFATAGEVQAAINTQLEKWWKGGISHIQSPSVLPLHLPKQVNPAVKEVVLFEIQNESKPVLIETNLRDNYLSLSSMVSRALPERDFIAVRSCPVGRCDYPIEDFGLFRNGARAYVRHVWVAHDGERFSFEQHGKALPYENVWELRTQRDSRPTHACAHHRIPCDVGHIGGRDLARDESPARRDLPRESERAIWLNSVPCRCATS